jgi:microcompartment protein CcmL/EutN
VTSTTGTSPLGFVEWDSIARGLEAADAMLKASVVEPVVLRPVSPGRYFAVVTGSVDAVRASVRGGSASGRESVIDQLVLPAPFPGLFPAVGGRTGALRLAAVGVIETLTLSTLFAAVDTAAKTGDVRVHDVRLAMGLGGKAFGILSGDVAQVEAAVASGAAVASRAEPSSPFRSFRTPILFSSRR